MTIIKRNETNENDKYAQLVHNNAWQIVMNSEELYLQFQKRLTDYYIKTNELSDYYLITRIKMDWYGKQNQVAKIILTADEFKQLAEKNKQIDYLIKANDLFVRAYADNGLFQEWIEAARKLYYLQLKHQPENQYSHMRGYAWALNQCGFHLKDTVMLDSCLTLQKACIKNSESNFTKSKEQLNILIENYSTHLLTLKRLKKYEEVLKIGRRALFNFDKYFSKQDQLYNYNRASFLASISTAHFHLGSIDSAFIYLEKAERHNPTTFFYTEGKLYYYYKLKQFDKIVPILDGLLFGKNKISNKVEYHYLCGWAAQLYYEAGKFKEAAFCYSKHKIYRDSTLKIQQKINDDYQRTNTNLIIQAEKKAAKIRQEQMELESKTARTQKNIILIFATIVIAIITLFLIIVIKRYKQSQQQKLIIESQKLEVETQKHLIDEKQKEILDSIHYAKRIQTAHLPSELYIKRKLNVDK